jgi:hypothetical protein
VMNRLREISCSTRWVAAGTGYREDALIASPQDGACHRFAKGYDNRTRFGFK